MGSTNYPILLPRRITAPVAKNASLALNETIRACLAGVGANEVLTYSFVSVKLLTDAGQSTDEAYQLQ